MPVPYKLNYFEIETGIDSTSTFIHTGDLTATKVKKYLGTSNDILLGDGTTASLSSLATLTSFSATSPLLYNNTTGVFSIPVATSIANGYLSSADWITFNAKQATITLTTTGTSGAATFISNVLNIPQYTDAFVGTVTSVAALTLGTTGTDLSSTVANSTTTPVITLNVPTASATNRGALSSSDWTTFNSKQAAGNYITSLTGEATASGPGASSVTLDNTAVIGKVLTGLNVTGGTVISTDSILSAFGKVQNQINGLVGGSIFQGTWDASTNTPALTSSVGTNGYYYIVSVDGSTNLNGITDWKVGDWAIFAGTAWQKVDNTDSVASVNGYTGTVSLVTGDVLEGAGSLPSRPSQLYFTDARARAAISLTTSGSSGASTYDSATGVLNIPNYLQDLSGYVTLATSQTITADKTFTTSGNTDTLTINHSSGAGIGLSITKGGNGEGIYVNKTSGSGNAATIIGTLNATTIVKSGGTSSQFLKADGTVDSTAYGTGTVTSVAALTLGTSGTDLSSSVANGTTTPVITLNVPDASATARGVVTTGNQTFAGEKTFNNNLISAATSWFSTNGLRKLTAGIDVPFSNSAGTVEFNFGNGGNFTANSLIKSGGTSAQFLKADGSVDNTSYGIGSVTSVAALTLGTSGTDLNSSVANGTTTPVITLNVPNSSATNRGALSSADWSTFNGKQNSITLTTTGSSGASTLIGSTLNIPNYGDALSGYLPLTGGTLTGALSGTTSTFTGTTESGVVKGIATSGFGVSGQATSGNAVNGNATTGVGGVFIANGTGGVGLLADSYTGVIAKFQASGSDKVTISNTGLLTGTSATLSGKLAFSANSGATASGQIGRDAIYGMFQWASSGTTDDWTVFSPEDGYIMHVPTGTVNTVFAGSITGTSATFSSSATASAFIPSGASVPTNGMYLSAANTLDFATNSLNRLSITSGGAATFANQVFSNAAGNAFFAQNGLFYKERETNGTGGTPTFEIALGYGVSSTTYGSFQFGNEYASNLKTSARIVLHNGTAAYVAQLIDGGTGVVTFSNLGGTGSRTVLADANGALSAPVSDISVKQNIKPIGYGLNEVLKMNPVWFDFVDDYKNYGQGRQNGNIAQELANIIPEAVFTTPSTGKMGINYDQLHAVYIKAIQELKEEIDILKNK